MLGHWNRNVVFVFKDESDISSFVSGVIQFLEKPFVVLFHDFSDRRWKSDLVILLDGLSCVDFLLDCEELLSLGDSFRLHALLLGFILGLHLSDKLLVFDLFLDPLLVLLDGFLSGIGSLLSCELCWC